MSSQKKHPRRLEGDPVGDQLFALFKKDADLLQSFRSLTSNEDLSLLIESHEQLRRVLGNFMVCEGYDSRRLIRATQFFQEHISVILAVLGVYSLPYCYAGANGARVLIESKKITENPGKRLAETAEFVMDICGSDAFKSEGRGLLSILNVRLLHSAARFYTSKKIKDEIPVNQDDQLATLLSFSLIVIRGLRKIGITISNEQANDFLILWALIGEKLGINVSYIPTNMREANKVEREIRVREFRRSEEGVVLTKSLLKFVNDQNTQLTAVRAEDFVHFFLEIQSDLLGVKPGLNYSGLLIRSVFQTQQLVGQFNGQNYQRIRHDLKRQLNQLDTELRF